MNKVTFLALNVTRNGGIALHNIPITTQCPAEWNKLPFNYQTIDILIDLQLILTDSIKQNLKISSIENYIQNRCLNPILHRISTSMNNNELTLSQKTRQTLAQLWVNELHFLRQTPNKYNPQPYLIPISYVLYDKITIMILHTSSHAPKSTQSYSLKICG